MINIIFKNIFVKQYNFIAKFLFPIVLLVIASVFSTPQAHADWTVANSDNDGVTNLNSISALSTSDVWGVGVKLTNNYSVDQTLIKHYDGYAWSTVASPNPGSTYNVLNGVAAVASDSAWSVA